MKTNVKKVMVNSQDRSDARGAFKPKSKVEFEEQQELVDQLCLKRMDLQEKIHEFSSSAQKKEHAEYMHRNAGPRAWLKRKAEMEERRKEVLPQLKQAIIEHEKAKVELRRLGRILAQAGRGPDGGNMTWGEKLDAAVARIERLEHKVAQLERGGK